MIKILNKYELEFIEFLNNKNFTDKECRLTILQGYDCIATSNDEVGFAVYKVGYKIIMLPTEVININGSTEDDIKNMLIESLAHEYKHFLQDINNQDFDEAEAEQFATNMVNEYKNKSKE